MICRNLQLRPLAQTTALLYLHIDRSSPASPGDTQGGSKQLQWYSTWEPGLVWVQQAREEVTEQGPPIPLLPDHTSPTMPQHRAPQELLPSPTWEPLLALLSPWCVLWLWIIWRSGYAPSNTRTALLQGTKSLRKVSIVFLGNGTRTSMGNDLLNLLSATDIA